MGILFVNSQNTGWLPEPEDIEEQEKFLEEKTKQKTVFLPIGCTAHPLRIGDRLFYIITQDCSSTVTEDQQNHVVEKIKEKTGQDTIFLFPGTDLVYFAN